MQEINKDNVIPNETILIKCGERFEVESFAATYRLKEIDRKNIGSRRLSIPAKDITSFKIYEEGKENRTYKELEVSVENLERQLRKANEYMDEDFKEKQELKSIISRLESENGWFQDQVHTGGGDS